MSFLLQYFLKLSVSLAIIYLFYYFILRRLTFYLHNRWYLAGYSLLCFFLSLINIYPMLEKNQLLDYKVLNSFPAFQDITVSSASSTYNDGSTSGWNVWNWLILVFILGFVLLLLRLIVQYISFCRIRRKAELLNDGIPKLYHVNKTIIPFSFGNSIFVNRSQHDEQELKEIIRHEFVHVKHKHTIDIIWSELLCALNWYNPFAWMIRKAIRQNLEFIADNNVLQSGVDKKQYQYLLLKVIGISEFSIANQFNFSSLKKRIAMMNKIKTARVQLIKTLFVLPVITLLLLAFRSNIQWENISRDLTLSQRDTIPEEINLPTLNEKDFLSRHPGIERINWGWAIAENEPGEMGKSVDVLLHIHFKTGKIEVYNLSKQPDIEKFNKTYGELPPKTPIGFGSVNSKGYDVDIKDNNGHCTVVVRNNSKLVKKIDLLEWNANKVHYESIYGEILPAIKPIATAAPETVVIGEEEVPVSSTIQEVMEIREVPVQVSVISEVKQNSAIPVEQAVPVINVTEVVQEIILEKILELKIYKSYKKADLDKLISEAKTKGVVLEFDNIEWNENNKLVSISGLLKRDNLKGNFNANDFEVVKLILFKKEGGGFLFRIDISEKKEVSNKTWIDRDLKKDDC